MISVCITLRFSLRHLSNLEDHAYIVVKKNKTKRNLTGDAPTPEKRKTNVFYCFENAKNVS